jgi:hypothetical protein
MTMTPRLRKVALVAHVSASVGWLGAVVAFLALAVAGLAAQDGPMVRPAYLAMDLLGWYALVPLAFASLLTGLLQSFGHPVGVVSALLGAVQARDQRLRHDRPVDVHADTCAPRRSGVGR